MIKNITKRYNELEKKSLRTTVKVKENKIDTLSKTEVKKEDKTEKKNNKKNSEDMDKNDLTKANEIINSINDNKNNVKRIKSENGLIERIDNNKVVLTEDNKMLLKD